MAKHPEKAYKNLDFLNSHAARPIRILCELEEVKQRFLRFGVDNTIVFFGSARAKPEDEAKTLLAEAEAAVAASPDDEVALRALRRAEVAVRLSGYYEAARELARRLTVWNMERKHGLHHIIATGGGPGIMEAGNRGAAEAGGKTVGLGISLPFEKGVNDWVTDGLDFEFHYFFTRKYWFLYLCKAMVIFPGGFGTMDEFFETLTLVQTGKITKPMPIVLFGTEYWNQVLNLQAMAEFGTISPEDPNLFHQTDSVDDAFQFLVNRLDQNAFDQIG